MANIDMRKLTPAQSNPADVDALKAALAAAQEKIAALQAKGTSRLTLKVSEKGALSVYGMGRWPVTLYRSQWERLLAPETVKAVQEFIAANAARLTVKE